MIREATEKVQARQDLARAEARAVMEELLSGTISDPEIITFLVAMREKGEQTAELVGFAEVMRARAAEHLRRVGCDPEALGAEPLLDTGGTGGDGQGTLNVATARAIVVAAAGVRVAKRGNRALGGRCGRAGGPEALAG